MNVFSYGPFRLYLFCFYKTVACATVYWLAVDPKKRFMERGHNGSSNCKKSSSKSKLTDYQERILAAKNSDGYIIYSNAVMQNWYFHLSMFYVLASLFIFYIALSLCP